MQKQNNLEKSCPCKFYKYTFTIISVCIYIYRYYVFPFSMYIVQCALYRYSRAHYTLWTVNCTLYSIQCLGREENIIQLYSIQYTVYSIQVQQRTLNILCTVHYTVYYIWQTVLSETRCLSFLYSNRIGLNASYTIQPNQVLEYIQTREK